MTQDRLAKWVMKGYPYLKECAGLPPWLLPERSFGKIVDGLGDGAILEMAQPLDLGPGIVQRGDLPDPEGMMADAWREACLRFPPLSAVRPLVEVCLEASDGILRQLCKGETDIDSLAVCRSIAVLAFAPFIPQGKALSEELAAILGGRSDSPAGLIAKYAHAVESGNNRTVRAVDNCIKRYPRWPEWFTVFEKRAADFPSNPRLIAVTPPLSEGLTDVMADMIKEAWNHGA